MAFFIDEQKIVENNIFKYEERLNSPISRFLDKPPTFVTYYHINVDETTVDDGFKDLESLIGGRSPLRFQKIENFPIYGLEPVILQLQDQDEGLDGEYQGESVILANTVKPLQNDFFMIKHVNDSYIFRITEVGYDSIRPDNYYKIDYRLEWYDDTKVQELNKQVTEKYTCILQNIGTENNCLIKEEYKDLLDKIDAMYDDIAKTYVTIFYNKRYNCFLGDNDEGYRVFDPLQSYFINKHNLFNKRNDYSTLVLTEGFADNRRPIKYEKSIYRFFERRDLKLINNFKYYLIDGVGKKDSSFARWNDESIKIVEVSNVPNADGDHELIPTKILDHIKYNGPEFISEYVELIKKFVRREELSIYNIPLDLNEELLKLNNNDEVYIFTPIIMYIIKTLINEFMSVK